jgi:uncharacterized membrane protein (DUF485 family)
MSLFSEEKDAEKEYQRLAALAIVLVGVTSLVWFVFHLIYCALVGCAFDFLSPLSIGRLVVAAVGITLGVAMHKFIDWGRISFRRGSR